MTIDLKGYCKQEAHPHADGVVLCPKKSYMFATYHHTFKCEGCDRIPPSPELLEPFRVEEEGR